MPFGPDCEYPDFDACVRANQGKDNPDGYCASLMEATEGECGKAAAAPQAETLAAVTEYRTFTATLTELGALTDDGRMLAADCQLSFRSFPLALGWQPRDVAGHEEAVTVGVIENAQLDGTLVTATGYFLNTPEADQAVGQITHGVTRPSVDLGSVTAVLTDADGNHVDVGAEDILFNPDAELVETVTEAKVLGATLVRIAAFDRPTDIQLTGTAERSDQEVEPVVAALLAAGERHFSDEFRPRALLFENPQLTQFTRPAYDEQTGRVFGHIAGWDVVHIGFAGGPRKVTAPKSKSGYAYFHTARVTTDQGNQLDVGKLTVSCGHAGLRMRPSDAAAHYDNTGTCWAYVRAGEDDHGIWFSGVLHPNATDDQIRDGLASHLSGDWRPVKPGQLELVAALSVNTPGFPLVASATDDHNRPLALVASIGGTDMALPPPPAKDGAPEKEPAGDFKFPEGSAVKVKDGGATGNVEKALDSQTVYRVDGQWYLENELEPAEEAPAQQEAVTAASIARELAAIARKDQAKEILAKVGARRRAQALAVLSKAGR